MTSVAFHQFIRFCINGLLATGVHFFCLTWLIEHSVLASAGLANLLAGLVGITTSFFGNRYFVFRALNQSIMSQLIKFATLYLAVLALHGIGLALWVDLLSWDYRSGFVIFTALQVTLSYFGGKSLVFSNVRSADGH